MYDILQKIKDFNETKHIYIYLSVSKPKGNLEEFSPSTLWVPGIEPMPLNLAASTFVNWIVSLAQNPDF